MCLFVKTTDGLFVTLQQLATVTGVAFVLAETVGVGE
jgi:hypothetical protein